MKKKSRVQIASQIVAELKREMQEPRLTESVRKGMSSKLGQVPKSRQSDLRERDIG